MARKDFDPFTALDGFDKAMKDLQKLREAYKLLLEVHHTLGAYGNGSYTDELRYKVNEYFHFDDSE